MHTPVNAEAPIRKFHPGQHGPFDHDDGSDHLHALWGRGDDDRAPSMVMPAAAAHRAIDPFDPRHGWEEQGDGHQRHHSSADAPDLQDGLIAVIGGSTAAAGEFSAVTGLVENSAEDRGHISIARGEAIFEASAHSSDLGGAFAAASTFLDVSGADFVIEHEIGQSKQGPYDAWARAELDYLSIDIHGWSPPQGPVVIDVQQPFAHHLPLGQDPSQGNFAQVLAMAEAHGADAVAATLTNALTVENHFSFVNAMGLVAV